MQEIWEYTPVPVSYTHLLVVTYMFRLSREIREVVVTGGNLSNPRAVALTLVEYGNLLLISCL